MIPSCLPYPTPSRAKLVASALVSLPTHLLCAIFNSWTLALISSSTKEASAVHYFHHIRWGLFCCACWGWKSRCTYNRRRAKFSFWAKVNPKLSEAFWAWVHMSSDFYVSATFCFWLRVSHSSYEKGSWQNIRMFPQQKKLCSWKESQAG